MSAMRSFSSEWPTSTASLLAAKTHAERISNVTRAVNARKRAVLVDAAERK